MIIAVQTPAKPVRRVRPFEKRLLVIPGAKKTVEQKHYHPMSHVELDGSMLCGFEDFDGFEADGSSGPGFSAHGCENCESILKCADDESERSAFDHFVDSLHDHETEETAR